MRKIKIYNAGVSNTIGFILIFTISVILMTSTVAIFNSLVENERVEGAKKVALEIANRVSDAIVEAVSAMKIMENTNYTKIVELPTMYNMNYYVELSNGTIYVNTTDGRVSVKKKIYSVKEIGYLVKGKVYGNAGKLKITVNHTKDYLSFDFGTPSSFEMGNQNGEICDYSPVEPGWIRITNQTTIFGGYRDWPVYDIGGNRVTFLYRLPILIDNTNYSYKNNTNITKYIESENLTDYPVAVFIPPDFPYHLVDKTSDGKPRIIFWEINTTGVVDNNIDKNEICSYWIESWKDDPPGTSTVWVKLHNVRNNSKELIYMCFAPVWNDSKEPINDSVFQQILSGVPTSVEDIFLYFEDFDINDYDGSDSTYRLCLYPSGISHLPPIPFSENFSFYRVYTGSKEPLTFIRLPYPSTLLCGKVSDYEFKEIVEEPTPPDDPDEGEYTENSTYYIVEAKVRFHGIRKIRGEILTNIDISGLNPSKGKFRWIGGFPAGIEVTLCDGSTKNIEDISSKDSIMGVKIGENPLTSEFSSFNVTERISYITGGKLRCISIHKRSIACVGNQSLCVLNTSTNSWEWVPACRIKEGDKVCVYNSSTHQLEWHNVTYVGNSTGYQIYSIVSPYGNFFANGFLVHSAFALGETRYSSSPPYLTNFGYDIYGCAEPTSSVPKFAIYKNLGNDVELLGEDYAFQVDYDIEKDTWYLMYTFVVNSRVKDWRNESWSSYIEWNYTLLQSWLFKHNLGGLLSIYTPSGIDTSGPYLSMRNLAIACGFIDYITSNVSSITPSFDIDWLRVRKSSKIPPRVSTGAVESYIAGWVDTTGIIARDRSSLNAIYRDFNNATHKKTLSIYLKGGNYTVTIYLGDPGGFIYPGGDTSIYNHTVYIYREENGVFHKIAGPIKILSSSHRTDQVVFTVSLPDDGNYHYLNLTFSAVELKYNGNEAGLIDPNAPSWVVNGIKIEAGDRTIRMDYV